MSAASEKNGHCPECGQELPKRCGYCASLLTQTGDGWGWMLRRRGADQPTLFGFSCGCYQRWHQAKELAEFENSVYLGRLESAASVANDQGGE